MKTFLIKASLFFVLITLLTTLFLYKYGGYVDYFYEKFTTPKAHSMIIGDSRAMQGIRPDIIDQYFQDEQFELPMLNYAFTIAQAHIGPLYRKSILKKIHPNTKNGLFVISINPAMLSSKKQNNNYIGEFKEKGSPPHNMDIVDLNPNFEYLFKNYNYFHFKAVFRQKSKTHKNGWLEERNLPKDSIIFKEWKQNQIAIFSDFYKNYKVSEYRKKSLDTLIKDLKKNGKVILLRTPISSEMLDLENEFYPNFNNEINSIAKRNNIKFINYTTNNKTTFRTYDGHHIDKFGSVEFTQSLCDSIKKYSK